jgi:Ca-activated chloride channel family protein
MNDDHSAADRDDLHDRLVDHALRELHTGERPPDLSARILAAAATLDPLSATPAPVEPASGRPPAVQSGTKARWAAFAIAASILFAAAGIPLISAFTDARNVAARSDEKDIRKTSANIQPSEGQTLPSPYYLTDDSQYSAQGAQSKQTESDLMLMVTPRELIAEELTSNPELVDAVRSAATKRAHENNIGLGGLIRNDSFGLEHQFSYPWAGNAASPDWPKGALIVPYDAEYEHAVSNHRQAIQALEQRQRSDELSDDEKAEVRRQIEAIRKELGNLVRSAKGSRDQYARINDNPFLAVSAANTHNRLSTFSIDVDTASYANIRQFIQSGTLPPPDAVRIEELLNYFDYDYAPPTDEVPFASHVEVAQCPWKPEHRLVRIGIKGREVERKARPLSNLVFLIDVSGSMNEPNKLPLLLEGMRMLTRELGENDRVAIVVYASSEGLALESTRGDQQDKILAALDQLSAGGSTAGGAGIQLAYQTAVENFVKNGVNRIVLCTDGDFNVGVTSPAELERMAETKAKETGVFLTVLGFGRGNLNDAMMEQIADKGNGNYHYIDSEKEANKVLVEEMSGTLVTIAKDVKLQVEFNPAKVAGYRLIGYENRVMAAEDFNDDKKDAGEIGAGHTVTALYEVVPVGVKVEAPKVDDLKYGKVDSSKENAKNNEDSENQNEEKVDSETPSDDLLTLKIRYKQPDGDESQKLEFPIADNEQPFAKASADFQFASAVASFGMLLRGSEHKGNATFASVAEVAASAVRDRDDPHGYRQEFIKLVHHAAQLAPGR